MKQHIYFLGIGGTLMGSLAMLAKEKGYSVTGSDNALYPPMSDQLTQAEISVYEGFDAAQLNPSPDLVVIGNAQLPRGHPGVEYVLESGLPYTSGAQWLGDHILQGRWVLAVSGTHGKTTTSSMLSWILHYAGLAPGYLIGGVPNNFTTSARLGRDPFFVVEADEYDASYFDRRSKFVHYRPRTLIINNLEYDHADIFPDLTAIQIQFHHLMRTVPGSGLVIAPEQSEAVEHVLKLGCWSPIERIRNPDETHHRQLNNLPMDRGQCWSASDISADGSSFEVRVNEQSQGVIEWQLCGLHNIANALNATAAARHAGISPNISIEALKLFKGVKRRMELVADVAGVRVYDDFAHHPTAIRTTLKGLRDKVGNQEIIAVVEPRSHTMSLGTLREELSTCCAAADQVIWFRGENIKWDVTEVMHNSVVPATVDDDLEHLVNKLVALPVTQHRHIVIMSNGGFGGIHRKLVAALQVEQSSHNA